MRGFLLGLLLVVALSATVLSIRPGGIRRQLRLAARRLRIVLWLGGAYIAASIAIRLAFPSGPVSDYALPALAVVLAAIFLVAAQDPGPAEAGSPRRDISK
ncbi:MAG TPA: hypothetical protein VHQ03_13240 [Candidatus Dormibacteraeota bacterium]|nr:hypothetical protein [Candidatus Dormibacteraeota bacterium]